MGIAGSTISRSSSSGPDCKFPGASICLRSSLIFAILMVPNFSDASRARNASDFASSNFYSSQKDVSCRHIACIIRHWSRAAYLIEACASPDFHFLDHTSAKESGPKQFAGDFESGRNSTDDPKMANSLPRIVPGVICVAKNAVAFAERRPFVLREWYNRAGCHIFCRVNLIVIMR